MLVDAMKRPAGPRLATGPDETDGTRPIKKFLRHTRIIILTVISCPFASVADPTVGVPLDHPVYRLIDRFEAKGWLGSWGKGTRPVSRNEVAEALKGIIDRSEKAEGLTVVESGLIDRLKVEFATELRTLGIDVKPEPGTILGRIVKGGHLACWDVENGNLFLDLLVRQGFISSGGNRASLTHVGGIVEGGIGGIVGFRLRHWEARQNGNRVIRSRADIVDRRVEFLEAKGKTGDFRESTAQMVLGTRWFDVEVGKNFESWGPASASSLFLSNNAPSYPFAKLRARYGRVKFVHLLGFLRSGLIDTTRTILDNGFLRTFDRRKYFSAHRVELGVSQRITVGLQEIVIYGDRRVEFAYAIPATFLFAAQSFLGDKDNVALGLDVDANVIRNLKFHGSLFLDDLTKFGGPGAFSNKFAGQAGFLWVDPGGLRDSEIRLEFVHIEPWVYTHLFNINRYQHYGGLLGHPLGPNSDGIYGDIVHRITPSVSFTMSASRERHGANPVNPDGTIQNVGGDRDLGQRPGDDVSSKRFLAGIQERRTRFGMKATVEPVLDLFLEAGYRRLAFKTDGVRKKEHEWTVTMGYNFY